MKELSELRLGIAGLGLIGGSLAAALHGHFKEISAWDIDYKVLESALDMGIELNPCKSGKELASFCDVLVLGVPLRYMEEVSLYLRPLFEKEPLAVMDVGSTKKSVGDTLSSIWGSSYVGLHPMAGKEYSGVDNASGDLFLDTRCAVVPGKSTNIIALNIADRLVRSAGAEPVLLDPEEHDRIVGCVSHLEITLASALSLLAGKEAEKHPDICSMVAGGFRDTTRLGSGPSWLLADMWETNRGNLEELLDNLIEILQNYRKSSPAELEKLAERGRLSREAILDNTGGGTRE